MVTPPKSRPAKVVAKKVAPSVITGATKKPLSTESGENAPEPSDKAMPFVIESEGLSAFVDHSDSVLPPAGEPVVATAKLATVVPEVPVEAPAVPPVAEIEPATEIEEMNVPTPPQPVVVEPFVAATKTAADWQMPHALEGHHIMNEAIETGKKFAEDAKARLQSIVGDFNEKAKVAAEKSSKAVEEFSDIAKGNVEALVESSKIAAKGVESMGQSAAEYGRASFEKTSATLKSFASIKSPVEFFQLQSELFTSAFDTMAAETSKTSEAFLKLAGEIAQPLSNRAAIVSDKLKALAA